MSLSIVTHFVHLGWCFGFYNSVTLNSLNSILMKCDWEVEAKISDTDNYFSAMSTMLVLFYLFCDGKTEDNLSQMFNMFDMDGNKVS